MKIKVDNVEEICAALKEVNGKSKTHTYTVLNLSDFYDKNLKDLPLPKKLWKGAKLYLWSGRGNAVVIQRNCNSHTHRT